MTALAWTVTHVSMSCQCGSSLPEEIDPEAFRIFLELGPVIPKKKTVRFAELPEICHFDEGVDDNGVVLDSVEEQQITEKIHVADLDDPCQGFLDVAQFWEDLEAEWTKVMQPGGHLDLHVAGRHEGEAGINEALEPIRFSDEEIWDEPDTEEVDDVDPPVSFQNWEQLIHGAAAVPSDQDGRIKLVTYGLRNVDLGRRDASATSLDPVHLRFLLWSTWQDCIPMHETMEVHFVLPQPLQEVGEPRAIILLIEIFDSPLLNFRPILTHSVLEGEQIIEHVQGVYVRWPLTRKTLIKRFRFWSYCIPFGFRTGELVVGHLSIFQGMEMML